MYQDIHENNKTWANRARARPAVHHLIQLLENKAKEKKKRNREIRKKNSLYNEWNTAGEMSERASNSSQPWRTRMYLHEQISFPWWLDLNSTRQSCCCHDFVHTRWIWIPSSISFTCSRFLIIRFFIDQSLFTSTVRNVVDSTIIMICFLNNFHAVEERKKNEYIYRYIKKGSGSAILVRQSGPRLAKLGTHLINKSLGLY